MVIGLRRVGRDICLQPRVEESERSGRGSEKLVR